MSEPGQHKCRAATAGAAASEGPRTTARTANKSSMASGQDDHHGAAASHQTAGAEPAAQAKQTGGVLQPENERAASEIEPLCAVNKEACQSATKKAEVRPSIGPKPELSRAAQESKGPTATMVQPIQNGQGEAGSSKNAAQVLLPGAEAWYRVLVQAAVTSGRSFKATIGNVHLEI